MKIESLTILVAMRGSCERATHRRSGHTHTAGYTYIIDHPNPNKNELKLIIVYCTTIVNLISFLSAKSRIEHLYTRYLSDIFLIGVTTFGFLIHVKSIVVYFFLVG